MRLLEPNATEEQIAKAIKEAIAEATLNHCDGANQPPTVVFIPRANHFTLIRANHPRRPIYFGGIRILASDRACITVGFDYPQVNDGPYDVDASMAKRDEMKAIGKSAGEKLKADVETQPSPKCPVFMHDDEHCMSTIRMIVETVMMKLGANNHDFRLRDELIVATAPYLDRHQNHQVLLDSELRRQKNKAWMRLDFVTADRIAALIGDPLPSEHERLDSGK